MISAKLEVERLIDSTLPFAKEMLKQHGEYHPFGAFLRTSGEIVQFAAKEFHSEFPGAKALIDLMRTGLSGRARSGEIRASAIIFDVRVSLPDAAGASDAVQIDVEHRDGYCAEVFFPYSIGEGGDLQFSATFAQQGDLLVFAKEA